MHAIIWVIKLRCEVLMKNKQPPFQITHKIIDDVADVAAAVREWVGGCVLAPRQL